MANGTSDGPLQEDERAELARLREEVATLREQTPSARETTVEKVSRPPRHGLRWTAVTILLVLVALLAVLSVTTRFVRSQILDTDRYVSTVAPLGENPAVQAEITNQVTDEIFDRVDVEGLTTEALTALTDVSNLEANAPSRGPGVGGFGTGDRRPGEEFRPRHSGLARSDAAVRRPLDSGEPSGAQLPRRVMTGNYGPDSVEVDQSGTVSISLSTIIDRVKTALTDRGFAFADKIPSVDKEFVLFQSPELVKAQRAVSALDKVSAVLPWLGIACAAAAVAVAPTGRRLRTLSLVGLSIALGMLVLAIGILIGRAIYLDSVPTDILSPDAATAVIDTVLVPLRTSLRAVAVLGVVVGARRLPDRWVVVGDRRSSRLRAGVGLRPAFCKRPNAESGGAVGQSASCPTALCHHRHRRTVAALLALPPPDWSLVGSSSLRSLLSSHWKYWFVPHAPPRRTPRLTTAEPTTPGPGQKIRKLRQRLCLDSLEFLFVDRA